MRIRFIPAEMNKRPFPGGESKKLNDGNSVIVLEWLVRSSYWRGLALI